MNSQTHAKSQLVILSMDKCAIKVGENLKPEISTALSQSLAVGSIICWKRWSILSCLERIRKILVRRHVGVKFIKFSGSLLATDCFLQL